MPFSKENIVYWNVGIFTSEYIPVSLLVTSKLSFYFRSINVPLSTKITSTFFNILLIFACFIYAAFHSPHLYHLISLFTYAIKLPNELLTLVTLGESEDKPSDGLAILQFIFNKMGKAVLPALIFCTICGFRALEFRGHKTFNNTINFYCFLVIVLHLTFCTAQIIIKLLQTPVTFIYVMFLIADTASAVTLTY